MSVLHEGTILKGTIEDEDIVDLRPASTNPVEIYSTLTPDASPIAL